MDDLFRRVISIPCSKMMLVRLPSRFWSPVNLLGMTQPRALGLQANEGRQEKGKTDGISQAKPASHPSTFHTTRFSLWFKIWLILDGQNPSRRILLSEIGAESVLTIRNTTTSRTPKAVRPLRDETSMDRPRSGCSNPYNFSSSQSRDQLHPWRARWWGIQL